MTLGELLIALAILSVLSTLAVSGARFLLAEVAIRTAINELAHTFHAARQHSYASGLDIAICPTRNGQHCDDQGTWQSGWLMFGNRDTAGSPEVDDGEPVLRHAGASSGVRISANRGGFVLRPHGRRSTNGTFVVCDPQQRADARRLVVSYTGKPRVEAATELRPQCAEAG